MKTSAHPTAREMERTARVIHPGDWAVEPQRPIATLLGSCVAVCLYDPKLNLGGMNHFMLPQSSPGKEMDDLLRGDFAMEVLINALLAKGAQKKRLIAKVFGGGNPVTSIRMSIGERNAQFAHEWLLRESIQVQASDVGGPWSRKILFESRNGAVWCKRILGSMAASNAVVREEAEYARRLNAPAQATRAGKKIELF